MSLSLIAAAAGAIYTANEYYQLKKALDRFPERLNETVSRIKDSIESDTYEFLTNEDCSDEPNNPEIESIKGYDTKIVKFNHEPDFIVKTSKVGLRVEFHRKCYSNLSGEDYTASNAEGGISRDLFCYARRVLVAKKLRKIIKENHLDKIKIPKKYLCSFPDHLVSKLSMPFTNRHVFILCERCDVDFAGQKSLEELRTMSGSEMEILAGQIHIFLSKSGILDFLPHNYYFKDGKLVIFDTEPMSLAPTSLLCISPTLRTARINLMNIMRNFYDIPEADILVDVANRSIVQIRSEERKQLISVACIAIFALMVVKYLDLSITIRI